VILSKTNEFENHLEELLRLENEVLQWTLLQKKTLIEK